jgi:LmbE family N-acetylglucosaminyl deacetylase
MATRRRGGRNAKPELSEDQRQELREAFELFDADKTGVNILNFNDPLFLKFDTNRHN